MIWIEMVTSSITIISQSTNFLTGKRVRLQFWNFYSNIKRHGAKARASFADMDWQRWLLCHISYTTTTFLQTQIPISTTNPKSVTAREGNIRKTKSFASFESYFCSLLVPMPVTVPTYITHNCVYVTCRQCLFITTIHIHVIFFFICSSPSRTFFFSFRSWPLF